MPNQVRVSCAMYQVCRLAAHRSSLTRSTFHFSICRQIGRLKPSEVRPTPSMPNEPTRNSTAAAVARALLPADEVIERLPLAGDQPLLGVGLRLADLVEDVPRHALGDLVADVLVRGEEIVGAIGRDADEEHDPRVSNVV